MCQMTLTKMVFRIMTKMMIILMSTYIVLTMVMVTTMILRILMIIVPMRNPLIEPPMKILLKIF